MARQSNGDEDPTLMAQILMTVWPSYSYIRGNVLPPTSLRLEVPLADEPDTMTSVRAHSDAGGRWSGDCRAWTCRPCSSTARATRCRRAPRSTRRRLSRALAS